MAISYYPNKIRRFAEHRNLIDDVDASDINNIQAELVAVMSSLGVSPHVFNDIQTDNTVTTVVPNDTGSVVDDDNVAFASTVRYYDPKVKPVDHGSVGNRLDHIERGYQHHCFRLHASGLDIPSGPASLSVRPKGVRFPKPSNAGNDPYDMHNGVGVTLRKSGFWVFYATLIYTLQGSAAGSNNGTYQTTIDVDGSFLEGMDRSLESGAFLHPVHSPVLMGFYNRGQRVSLRTAQNSGRSQKIRIARLAGFLLRENPGG